MGYSKYNKFITLPTGRVVNLNRKYDPINPNRPNTPSGSVKKDGNCPHCWYGDLHNGKCSNCHKGNLKPRTREQIHKGMN